MSAVTFNLTKKDVTFRLFAPSAIGVDFNAVLHVGKGNPYDGEYVVAPDFVSKTLATKDRFLRNDVTVLPIEVSRVSNPAGGKTIFIGGIING